MRSKVSQCKTADFEWSAHYLLGRNENWNLCNLGEAWQNLMQMWLRDSASQCAAALCAKVGKHLPFGLAYVYLYSFRRQLGDVCHLLEGAAAAVIHRGDEAKDQAAHNRFVGGSNPLGPTFLPCFWFLNLKPKDLVYLTQKTRMKNVITVGFTRMGRVRLET